MFNPEKEFNKLKETGGGEKRFEAYVEFMQKRKEQKENISKLVSKIIEKITENPEIKIEDLKKFAEEKIKEEGLPNYQKELIFKGIREYEKRNKEIKRLKDHAKTGNEIYKKFFGKEPKRIIETFFGPITIHLRCGEEDYKQAMSRYPNTKPSAGTYLTEHKILSLENTKYYSIGDTTRIHEEGHALKNLFDEIFSRKQRVFNHKKFNNKLKSANELKDPQKREVQFMKISTELIRSKEESIKDEIIAHFRGGEWTQEQTFENLKQGGYYDYFEYEKNLAKDILKEKEDYDDFVSVFKKEHDKVMKFAIESYAKSLSLMNNKKDAVMTFLNDIPLHSWPKELRRLELFTTKK